MRSIGSFLEGLVGHGPIHLQTKKSQSISGTIKQERERKIVKKQKELRISRRGRGEVRERTDSK